MENLKFCYEKRFKLSNLNTSEAVAVKSKYWNKGYNIKIFFMGGTAAQKFEMKSVINELVAPLSLTVEYVNSANNSDVRIDFKAGYGSWSYLGTDCLFLPKTEQTLNIGWAGKNVMYHEFCHTLNLSHEHQNPSGGIVWNEQEVIRDLSGSPNYWTEAEIRHNVLNKLTTTETDFTTFDSKSVMLYYFPNSWTIGDFQTNSNPVPSSTDKTFLYKIYGKINVTLPTLTLKGKQKISIMQHNSYTELGATALDNTGKDISNKINIHSNIDTSVLGLQYVVYSVYDDSGYKSEKIRTILVRDKVTIVELSNQVNELQAVLDIEQEQIRETIINLSSVISDYKDMMVNWTPSKKQDIINKLKNIKVKLEEK